MQGDFADGTTGRLPELSGLRHDGVGAPVTHAYPWPRRASGALFGCCTALLGLLYFAVPGGLSLPFALWPVPGRVRWPC